MTTTSASLGRPARLRTYASFVRFEHTLFSLPLLVAGVFSVPGPSMSAGRWALAALAAVGARTAAMALNRLIDRRLDGLNPRTQNRELPSGNMSLNEALALLVIGTGIYLLACVSLGRWYLAMAPIPLAVFALYPYLKRFTPLCHFGVGLALGLAPLAGYAVAHPDLAHPGPALWLAAFAFFWVSGFDVIYATLDEASDRAQGVRSLPARLGRGPALRVSAALHGLAFLCLAGAAIAILRHGIAYAVAMGRVSGADFGFTLAPAPILTSVMLGAAGVLLYLEQHWAEDVNLAFFRVNVWVGVLVMAMVLAARLAGGFGA